MPKQFHNEIMAKIWDHILFEGLTRKGEGEGGGRGGIYIALKYEEIYSIIFGKLSLDC